MKRYVAYRVAVTMPVLLGVLVVGFLLMQVVPSDPAAVRAGPQASAEVVAALREEMGLNRALPMRFALYLRQLARGDLGRSLINDAPVATELGRAIGPSMELMTACLLWSVPVAVALGTFAAYRRNSVFDRAIVMLSIGAASVPVFFVGLLAIWIGGFWWQLLPFTGRGGPFWTRAGLASLVLPAFTLGFVLLGAVVRITRTAVLDALSSDHVRTARAKGLSEWSVTLRHALRNALIPIVTLVGLQIGYLIGGAVATEIIFSWPGMGRLAVNAITSSDLPMAQGAILVIAAAFVLTNLAVDLLQLLLDPRIRR
ncbi:glutathione ABC transporter permease [Gluconacetobacter liquefaciens]|nr:ABC transporter permease [Gluconacetobacter liquefaciens]MBB2185857.1 ABC transporter permease [Gluconacetobacter liquefaciens]GBR03663.1 hypothetical protein AA0522_1778 [Gluconacetobacter liquefaciens NRIC 0522]GEB36307.1 glutathione ABC transporter permease [Gluconacetobacter liquefaciens]